MILLVLEESCALSWACWAGLSPWAAPQLFKDTTPTSSRVGDWEWQLSLFRRVLWKAWSLSWGEQLYLDKNWMSLLLEIACFLMPSSWRNGIVCALRVPSINFDDAVLLVFPFKKNKEGGINHKYLNLASNNCLLLFLMWWFPLEHRVGYSNCSVESDYHKAQLQMINSSKLQLCGYFATDLLCWEEERWLDLYHVIRAGPICLGSKLKQGTDPNKHSQLDISSGWRQLGCCWAPTR